MSNFGKIGQSVTKILRFFNFSQWRTPPSWIFKFVKFHWQTVSGRHRLIIVLNVVKIGRLIVEILQFFEFSKWPLPLSWIFWNREILLAIRLGRFETHQQAKFCQNWSIGCKDTKILSIFQGGGRRHLGFAKSWIFICSRYLEGPGASLYQILSKSVVPLRRYCYFSNFPDGRPRHLGFLKSRNFVGHWSPECGHASVCQIS